ncbi:hypothetical protein DUNSADRAFT_5205 [Dunaliella salina]|uniref:cysteine dioxygenase n=1 Tax=Dunaliella salina TaxID=3046 RepID=A0ABQ7FUG5_DUNSA|nr:hypothetical protein DUNSADRAFT_5205 [Dunaliella salina]|eukprot:KAF5826051.1 hypothetical protein DUNSADRAFT_5205 [Dunaliella salina]
MADKHTLAMCRGKVSYQHIYEDPEMTLGIFLLPANASIPLHDHPGMTVISRLLFGTMQIKAYDLVDVNPGTEQHGLQGSGTFMQGAWQWPFDIGQQRRHVAQLKLDTTISAKTQGDPLVLHPRSCNLHVFQAATPCAMLDLLTPPYEPGNGRDCTYYREMSTLPPQEPAGTGAVGNGHSKQAHTLVELEVRLCALVFIFFNGESDLKAAMPRTANERAKGRYY